MPEVPEYVVNVKLAEILSEDLGIDARAERVKQRKRPDIRCYYRGLIIGVEASYSREDAEKDAKARVEQGLVDVALALWIKERFRDVPEHELKDQIKRSKFAVKVFVPEKVSGTLIPFLERGVRKSDVDLPTLKTFIDQSIEFLTREEEVSKLINEVKQGVSDFTTSLQDLDKKGNIRKQIYSILYKLYGLSVAETEEPEVAFGHAALSILLSAVFYEHIRGVHTELEPLSRYVDKFGPIEGLKNALKDLLKIDYRTAVETTIKILEVLPSNIAYRVKELVNLAIKIAQNRALLRRDFAGRVYHEITGDIALRKGFATFYTEVPAAYLLATLAVETLLGLNGISALELDTDTARRLVEKIRNVKVGDFACGSGTLLTASYYSLHRLATAPKYYHDLDDVDLNVLGREIIENNIYGIDALKYASQIAAVNLALIGPEIISKENVYTIYLGYIPKKNQAWLGSLELLNNAGKVGGLLAWIEKGLSDVVERVSIEGTEGTFQIPSKFDMIIMNPPFTRATGRTERFRGARELFGFITDESIREKLLKRYREVREHVNEDLKSIALTLLNYVPDSIKSITRGEGKLKQYLAIGQAGEGLLFLYLAYRYVKDGGVIAFVLPRGLLAGVSWFLARALLASKFHVKYVVVSSDPEGGYNFSEGASLSETLIVARRTDSHGDDDETIFVNLLRKPRTATEAIEFGETIKREARKLGSETSRFIEVGKSRALIIKVRRRTLLRYLDNWNRFAAILDPELVYVVMNLHERGEIVIDHCRNASIKRHGIDFKVPITPLNSIIDRLGIDRHEFNDLFSVTKSPTQYPILHSGEEEVRKLIKVKPNAYADPKPRRAETIFKEYCGKVLVPNRIRWNTAHVVALYSQTPILSNLFYAVRLNVPNNVKEYTEKALVLWLNTTWGLLTVLTNRQETEGAWTELTMAQYRLLPVLNVNSLDIDTLKRLVEVFDKYSDKSPTRIPEQFNPESPDEVRLGIDIGFIKALRPDINEDEVRSYLLKLYSHVHIALKQWIGE